MYKTYQNSSNPDWQPHIAWREIIHVIIDPVSQSANGNSEQSDFAHLACYGDMNTNFSSIGSIPILHATGDEYIRCINIRKNAILRAKRKLPRAMSDANKHRPITRRINSLDQQQIDDTISHSTGAGTRGMHEEFFNAGLSSVTTPMVATANPGKRSKNIFKNVNRIRWTGKNDRNNPNTTTSNQTQQGTRKRMNSPTITTALDEQTMPADAISLVSNLTF